MTPNDASQKPPLSMCELLATLRAEGRLIEDSESKGSVAIVGVPMPPPEPPTSGDSHGAPDTGPDEPKPLKAILGKPRLRPGESKEDAARRLAREMFGKVKPVDAKRHLTPEEQEIVDLVARSRGGIGARVMST